MPGFQNCMGAMLPFSTLYSRAILLDSGDNGIDTTRRRCKMRTTSYPNFLSPRIMVLTLPFN